MWTSVSMFQQETYSVGLVYGNTFCKTGGLEGSAVGRLGKAKCIHLTVLHVSARTLYAFLPFLHQRSEMLPALCRASLQWLGGLTAASSYMWWWACEACGSWWCSWWWGSSRRPGQTRRAAAKSTRWFWSARRQSFHRCSGGGLRSRWKEKKKKQLLRFHDNFLQSKSDI